jgi:hypothetical protein
MGIRDINSVVTKNKFDTINLIPMDNKKINKNNNDKMIKTA